jgi:hypothetical protein
MSGQSRLGSLKESLLNTGIGFGISLIAQMIVLPVIGVTISHTQNVVFACIMTVVSVARTYCVRRLFEKLGIRVKMSPFVQAVLAERTRQQSVEGFDVAHDDAYQPGELAEAGAAYLLDAGAARLPPPCWPWSLDWWKPEGVRRDLVKGCALGLAEGEKFDRNRRKRARATASSVQAAYPDPSQAAITGKPGAAEGLPI